MIIRDQIHGDIVLSDSERELIETPVFERLRCIKQLAFAEYEYPGATHTRYQHSIGACQCITDMYEAVCKNSPEFYRNGDLQLLRYMALVHDLGHAPFSHASEALSDITHEERLKDILQSLKKVIKLDVNPYGIPDWELIYQVYNGTGIVYMSNPHLITLHDFMDGIIDADKIDYLERDAMNCGVKYGVFDRQGLINSLCIVRTDTGLETLGILQRGVQALESFVLARYYMFNQVYMHPEERILRIVASEEVKQYLPNGKYPNEIGKYLKYDDHSFVKKLNCLRSRRVFNLIYDGNFVDGLKKVLERRFGDKVLVDAPQKTIFRSSEDSPTILVKTVFGSVVPCEKVSPILENIRFVTIHKIRVYTMGKVSDELQENIRKVVEKYV